MTVIDAETPQVEAENEGTTVTESKRGRAADRDFTKANDRQKILADFINNHPKFQQAGLPPVTAEQVKAVQLLADDFRNTPEQIAAREARAAERKAEEAEFVGLNADEKKELRAANRKAKALAEVEARRQELLQKAQQIRESAEASGEDLASVVEGDESKRRIGRRK